MTARLACVLVQLNPKLFVLKRTLQFVGVPVRYCTGMSDCGRACVRRHQGRLSTCKRRATDLQYMRAGASPLAGKFLSENLTVHDALSFSPASYVVVIASKCLLSRVSLGFLFDLLTFLLFFSKRRPDERCNFPLSSEPSMNRNVVDGNFLFTQWQIFQFQIQISETKIEVTFYRQNT